MPVAALQYGWPGAGSSPGVRIRIQQCCGSGSDNVADPDPIISKQFKDYKLWPRVSGVGEFYMGFLGLC